MADALSTNPVQNDMFPYALGIRTGSKPTEYLHFDTPQAAEEFAYLMNGAVVTRFVAICEPEYVMTAVTPGWRQVIAF